MNYLKFSALALMLTLFTSSFAQNNCNQTLSIQVVDENTDAIMGAMVNIIGQQSITDYNGMVVFENLCFGDIHLEIVHQGYEIIDMDTFFYENGLMKFVLKNTRQTLDEIEVIGHKAPMHTTKGFEILGSEEIQKSVQPTLGSVLSKISGVDLLKSGNGISKPILNGMHSNRLLILNNGIRQEGQQWGSEHAPEIDPNAAANITIIKGAESIRYGSDAIGGVVLVNPKLLRKFEPISGIITTQYQSNGKGGHISGQLYGSIPKIPKLAFGVNASLRRLGNQHAADYFLENTGIQELNYAANFTYIDDHSEMSVYYSQFNSEVGILETSHIGSMEDLLQIIERGRPLSDGHFTYEIDVPKQRIQHHLIKAELHKHINDNNHINVQYGVQRNVRKEFDRRRGGRSSLPSLDIGINSHTLDAYWDYFNGENVRWQTGFNFINQYNESNPETLTLPLIPDYAKNGLGIFSLIKYTTNKYALEAGIRGDGYHFDIAGFDRNLNLFHSQKSYYNFSTNISTTYYPNNNWILRSSMGNAFRPPSVNELYSSGLHHGSAQMEYGDSNLTLEKSYQGLLELNYHNEKKTLSINTMLFANYFSNYIFLKPMNTYYQSLRGAFPEFKNEQTKALFYGVNLTMNYEFIPGWHYELKPTIVLAKDVSQDKYLPFIPAPKLLQSISFIRNLNRSLKQTVFSINHLYVSEQTRYNKNADFAPPPAAYHLWGASAGSDILIGKEKFAVLLSVENIFNTSYKDYMNRYRYFAHDLGRNFVFNIQYKF